MTATQLRRRVLALMLLLAGACGGDTADTLPSTAADTPTTTVLTTTTTSTTTTTTTTQPPTTTTTLPLAEVAVEVELVADDFEQPVFVTTRSGDPRLYVVDQVGIVYALDGGDPSVVLDINTLTRFAGEQGLLGLAFHPTAPERMFVHYSDNSGDTVIAEYRLPMDALLADPDPVQIVLEVAQPASNHNGGMIAFGPDGYFYVALGDGGGGGDPFDQGQNPHTLLGAILRLDLDGTPPYAIPPANPFVDGSDGALEVWAIGLRNPWRFSFDGDDMWIADVGQGDWEEITRITVHDGGANLGWPILEGSHCYRGPADLCAQPGFIAPTYEYPHTEGRCSVTGGYVYRGDAIPSLTGAYLFSDWCTGDVRALRVDAAGMVVEDAVLVETPFRLTSFGTDGAGEIYFTRESGVYRLIPAP